MKWILNKAMKSLYHKMLCPDFQKQQSIFNCISLTKISINNILGKA